MPISSFVDATDEDADYEPPEMDEKCTDPFNFPNCVNGQYIHQTRGSPPDCGGEYCRTAECTGAEMHYRLCSDSLETRSWYAAPPSVDDP